MDEKTENSEKTRRAARGSLVERAAQKIVADQAPAKPRSPEPAPAPAPAPVAAQGNGAVAEALPPEMTELVEEAPPGQGIPGQRLDEESLQVATLTKNPGSEGPPKPTQPGQKRTSKIANIDFESLAASNILTPDTKRNRTVEEFRLIKRMILSRRWDHGEGPGNTIVVTSALPSEGKTTTAINLAMSIAAEEDLRVLLVDADFIKPDALRQLGVTATKGLIDVIEDPHTDISDVMLRTNIDKLSLIPAGQLHHRCTELLASARMDELITELASRYEDRILIFDSPPVLATTESVVLASHMGQVIFVVQAGRTKRESVNSALELIGDRPNMGLVLNRSSAGLGSTEFGSYYSSYYYGYGDKD